MSGINPLNLALLIVGAILLMSGINNKSPKETITDVLGNIRGARVGGGGNPRKPQNID